MALDHLFFSRKLSCFQKEAQAHLNRTRDLRSNPAKEGIHNDTVNSKEETAESLCETEEFHFK